MTSRENQELVCEATHVIILRVLGGSGGEGAWLGRFGWNSEVKECDILSRSVTWPKIPFLRISNLKIFVNNIDFDTFGSIKRVLLGLRSYYPFYVVRTFFSAQNLGPQGCCLTNVSRSPEVQKPRSWSPYLGSCGKTFRRLKHFLGCPRRLGSCKAAALDVYQQKA